MLGQDRTSTLARAIAIAVLASGLLVYLYFSISPTGFSILSGVVCGLLLAFGASLGTAWTWYQAARIHLALCGRLPWRLQTFLGAAHELQILRRAGSVYQFRHGLLQDHLRDR